MGRSHQRCLGSRLEGPLPPTCALLRRAEEPSSAQAGGQQKRGRISLPPLAEGVPQHASLPPLAEGVPPTFGRRGGWGDPTNAAWLPARGTFPSNLRPPSSGAGTFLPQAGGQQKRGRIPVVGVPPYATLPPLAEGVPPTFGRRGGWGDPTNAAWAPGPRGPFPPTSALLRRAEEPSSRNREDSRNAGGYLSLRWRREYRRRRSRGGWGDPTNAAWAPGSRDLSLLPAPSFVGRRNQPRRKREDSRSLRSLGRAFAGTGEPAESFGVCG